MPLFHSTKFLYRAFTYFHIKERERFLQKVQVTRPLIYLHNILTTYFENCPQKMQCIKSAIEDILCYWGHFFMFLKAVMYGYNINKDCSRKYQSIDILTRAVINKYKCPRKIDFSRENVLENSNSQTYIHTHTHARTHARTHTEDVWDTYTSFISETELFWKKVSDKSYEVLNGPFSDLINLTFDSITKVRAMSIWIF